MQHRLFLLSFLVLPLGLASCFGPPQGEDIYPYGPPRYGHGGTQSPPPAGPPGPPPAGPQGQGQGYDWQNQNPGNTAGTPGPSGGQNPPRVDPSIPGPNVPDPSPSVTQNDPPRGGANTGTGGAAQPPADTAGKDTPYGIPVPGKDGMLYSPYKPDAGFIDITTRNADGSTSTLPPGTKIKDPFSGKAILVP